jgi:hypothetical protein
MKSTRKRHDGLLTSILAPLRIPCQSRSKGNVADLAGAGVLGTTLTSFKMIREEVSEKQIFKTGKNGPFITPWNALLARRGIIAYLPIIIVVILMFFGASWQFFWLHTDAARYQCYAITYWLGSSGEKLLPSVQCAFLNTSPTVQAQPPFHMLPLEYPPLTLVIFSLALIAPVF